MNRSLATISALFTSALFTAMSLSSPALAQGVPSAASAAVCNQFLKLREDAQNKAKLVKIASERKDRKAMCDAITRFAVAEDAALKFLENNTAWCGIPQEVVAGAKVNHDKTLKFRTMVCSAGPTPKPHAQTLSDAISTPTVDTAKNTKTGEGTFDTLTGNPLAK